MIFAIFHKLSESKSYRKARAHNLILKVNRTIADLDRPDTIEKPHLIQAIQYQSLDRDFWNY